MNMYVHSFLIVPEFIQRVFHCTANPDKYGHKVNENFYTSVAAPSQCITSFGEISRSPLHCDLR